MGRDGRREESRPRQTRVRRLRRPVAARVVGVVVAAACLGLVAQPGAASSSPPDVPVATLELPTRTVEAGSGVRGTLTVQNATGAPITFPGCNGFFFWAYLANEVAQQLENPFPRCLEMYSLPEGSSTFAVGVSGRYTGCSPDPQSGSVGCLPDGRPPPLPPGDYRLTVVADGLQVELPVPLTVHVVAAKEKRPSGVATARIELVSPILTAGNFVRASMVIGNGTGRALTFTGCDGPLLVALTNDATEAPVDASPCFRTYEWPMGESFLGLTIAALQGACQSESASRDRVQCVPTAQPPPLPVGVYRVQVVGNDPAIKLSKPPRVFVVSDDCASDVMTVAVPDVVGKRLAEARRLVEATDLKVVSFSTYRTDGAPDNARIEAQVPAAGAIVSRGSCMGLRAR